MVRRPNVVSQVRQLMTDWLTLLNHFAFTSKTVMEQGGNVRVKLVPRSLTFSVTGMRCCGSLMVLVSVRFAALSTVAWPLAATDFTPLMSIVTGCAVSALLTIFKVILPLAPSRVAE